MVNKQRIRRTQQPSEIDLLHKRIEQLEQRCVEAEESLEAIRSGAVDALVISTEQGEKVYTLQGADTSYRILVESMNEGAATLVEDGTILYCNRRFAEMLGTSLEALMGSVMDRYVSPEDREIFSTLFSEGIKEQNPTAKRRGEVTLIRHDRTTIPVMLSFSSYSADSAPGVCIVATDLTERKIADEMRVLLELKTRAEEALRAAHDDLIIVNENLIAEVIEHKKTEAKLQATQQGLETIINYLPSGVALIRGSDLRVQLVNLAFQAFAPGKKMVGYTLDEIAPEIGRDFSDIARRVLETGEPHQVVDGRYQIRRATHAPLETVYFSWSLHRVHLPGDQGWGLLTSAWETTSRMQIEAALTESRNKYQALIETTGDFIWEIDQQGRYTYCSPQMETLWGLKPQEMIGKTPFDLMPPELAQQGIEDYKNLASYGQPIKGMTSISYDSNGQLIYIEINGVPFFDHEGRLLGYRGITRDVTKRKRAEEKLQQAYSELEQRVRERTSELLFLNEELKAEVIEREKAQKKAQSSAQLAEGLAQSIITMNSSLDLGHVLDAILDQLRLSVPYSVAAITQFDNGSIRLVREKNYHDDLDIMQAINVSDLLENHPQLKKIGTRKAPLIIEDTTQYPKWVLISGFEWVRSYLAIPLIVGERLLGTIHLCSDHPSTFTPEMIDRVTAFSAPAALAIQNALLYHELQTALQNEQMMRLQLIQAEKLSALSRMLATVVHEINNPVQTVKNCLYLAKQDLPESSNAMETLNMATTEVNRIGNLVSGLRNIYRKPRNTEMEPLDVARLIAEVHTLLDPHLAHNKVTWEQQDSENPLWTSGVADHLKQVFINISMNAIEAMEPNGGKIRVSLQDGPEKGEVSVSVTDTGCGINIDDVPKLFEPFYTTKEGGSGLGLPICYEIIQQHSGRILVDSALGKGTKFTVCLPSIYPPGDGS